MRVIVGDCRDVLAGLPERSVQCVVTSPPYWGLRAYGTEPQVWGGDGSCGDEHEWGAPLPPPRSVESRTPEAFSRKSTLGSNRDGLLPSNAGHQVKTTLQPTAGGSVCARCGAWRGELGAEPTPKMYVANIVTVFREVRRILRPDGTLWLNLGDAFLNKQLLGIPWRVALALQGDGWYLRSDCIWSKPNPLPESVTDRPTRSHEYVFMFSKRPRYFYDAGAIREPAAIRDDFIPWRERLARGEPVRRGDPSVTGHKTKGGRVGGNPANGRNRRTVWTIPTAPFPGAHFATFPPALVDPCIKAGTSEKGRCGVCGAPWVRVVERGRAPKDRQTGRRWVADIADQDNWASGTPTHSGLGNTDRVETTTVGWRPSCTCDGGEPVPCTVLDPFAGAGTVGLVANRLGRDAVLIELNPDYAAMARARIAGDAPMFAVVS